MEVIESKEGNCTVLELIGRLDAVTSSGFETKLMAAIDTGKGNVLLDCAQLDYVSSAGLRVLLVGARKMKARNGQLHLAAVHDNVRQVMEISGVAFFFGRSATRSDALRELGVGSAK